MSTSDRSIVPKLRVAAVVALILLGLLYLWWRYRPTSPAIARLEASRCQLYYKNVRTAADSARVADGYWVVDHSWRRTPTCGELLRQGKLSQR
jgi:hypothetical protein